MQNVVMKCHGIGCQLARTTVRFILSTSFSNGAAIDLLLHGHDGVSD